MDSKQIRSDNKDNGLTPNHYIKNTPGPGLNFGSYHSPYLFNGVNDGGSIHNYFGRSPPSHDMHDIGTPLRNLLNSQHQRDSPNFLGANSPQFGGQNFRELLVDINDIRNDCRSEGRSSVMSSLSEASYGRILENQSKNYPKNSKTITILDKNLEVVSHKDMTMDNVIPGKNQNIFGDLGPIESVESSQYRPKLEAPHIAGEALKLVGLKLPSNPQFVF